MLKGAVKQGVRSPIQPIAQQALNEVTCPAEIIYKSNLTWSRACSSAQGGCRAFSSNDLIDWCHMRSETWAK
jgi:hypothetical protein